MQALHRFRFACGFTSLQPDKPMTMADAKQTAKQTAFESKQDCQMHAFNDALRRWEHLATYHADGSWHDSFGDKHEPTT